MPEPTQTEFHVHCADCGHQWIAAYVPMEVTKFARLGKGLCCPKCGAPSKRIVCGWKQGKQPA